MTVSSWTQVSKSKILIAFAGKRNVISPNFYPDTQLKKKENIWEQLTFNTLEGMEASLL